MMIRVLIFGLIVALVWQGQFDSHRGMPWHTNITATVFWIGEPKGGGSSEDNSQSAWDDEWRKRFGCFDDPFKREGWFPKGCIPKENPFYADVPYNDFNHNGARKKDAYSRVPWSNEKAVWGERESLMKNRWVEIHNLATGKTAFAQIEDAGPYEYNDWHYVFGRNDERPKSQEANNAGMDVSPAVRDYLGFIGANNDENKVSWRFVSADKVPDGPWKKTITTSQINWP